MSTQIIELVALSLQMMNKMTGAVDHKTTIEHGIALMNTAPQTMEQLKATETRLKKTTRMKKTTASPAASRT